jgi:hypothetical protein
VVQVVQVMKPRLAVAVGAAVVVVLVVTAHQQALALVHLLQSLLAQVVQLA